MAAWYYAEAFMDGKGFEMSGTLKDTRLERLYTPNGPHARLNVGLNAKGKFSRAGANFSITLECDQTREKIEEARQLALEFSEEGLAYVWNEFMQDLQSAKNFERLKEAIEK